MGSLVRRARDLTRAQWLGVGWAIVGMAIAATLLMRCATLVYTDVEGALEQQSNDPSILFGRAAVITPDILEIGGKRVRVEGIEAPNSKATCEGSPADARARNPLIGATSGRNVRCWMTGDKVYGVEVAVCRVGERDLAELVVAQGYARDWPLFSKGRYADEERLARAQKLGVWGKYCSANLWGDRP